MKAANLNLRELINGSGFMPNSYDCINLLVTQTLGSVKTVLYTPFEVKTVAHTWRFYVYGRVGAKGEFLESCRGPNKTASRAAGC